MCREKKIRKKKKLSCNKATRYIKTPIVVLKRLNRPIRKTNVKKHLLTNWNNHFTLVEFILGLLVHSFNWRPPVGSDELNTDEAPYIRAAEG